MQNGKERQYSNTKRQQISILLPTPFEFQRVLSCVRQKNNSEDHHFGRWLWAHRAAGQQGLGPQAS
jgi:hypothetical protein